MSSIAELPDLAKDVPLPSSDDKDLRQEEGEMIDEVVEKLHTIQGEVKMDVDELAARAREYEKKIGKTATKEDKQAKDKALHPPEVASSPPSASSQTNQKTKPKKQNSAAAKARLALNVGKTTASSSDVKQIVPPDEKETAVAEKKDKGKEKEVMPTPTSEETGAQWDVTETTPRIGDEEFPMTGIPHPSRDYSILSTSASQYEDVASDMSDLANQMREMRGLIASLNLKMASLDESVTQVQGDKSQFLSNVMDRLRALERSQGNLPSLGTPARSLVPIVETDQWEEVKAESPVLSKAEMLAKARAKKAKK